LARRRVIGFYKKEGKTRPITARVGRHFRIRLGRKTPAASFPIYKRTPKEVKEQARRLNVFGQFYEDRRTALEAADRARSGGLNAAIVQEKTKWGRGYVVYTWR